MRRFTHAEETEAIQTVLPDGWEEKSRGFDSIAEAEELFDRLIR